MKKLLEMSEEEIDALDEDEFQEHFLELGEEDQLKLLEKFPELKELIEDPFASFKEGMSPEEAAEFDKLQKDDMTEEELDALLEEEENEEIISDEELDEFIEDNFSENELKEIDELIENQKNDNSKKISEEDLDTGLSEEDLKELDE